MTAQGESRRAVQLWGTAAAIRAAIVAPMPPIYRPDYIQAVAVARESLSEEDFQTAWTEMNTTGKSTGESFLSIIATTGSIPHEELKIERSHYGNVFNPKRSGFTHRRYGQFAAKEERMSSQKVSRDKKEHSA